MRTDGPLDLGRFEVMTFDCYGTLIDWETGLLAGLHAVLDPRGVEATDDGLLEAFAATEADLERGPYLPYREILGRCLRAICAQNGVEPTEEEVARFGGSVVDWPTFPDSSDALARLATRYRLGVITNCDDDLLAGSARRLGISFDWIVTAQQLRSYKPDPRNIEAALERIGRPRDRVLHVAQSLFHDHVPAKALGLATVWVDRRRDRPGFGATPPAEATPDLVVPDMRTLADLAAT
jgi:2-haloacid dehalogenase